MINNNNINDNINIEFEGLELLEFFKYILGCTYISDLRIEPYNTKAKIILRLINPKKYSSKQIKDAFEYLYSENKK